MNDETVTNSELARSLARIEMKLERTSDDHESRLRRVERFVWVGLGLSVAGALSGITSMVAAGNVAP